MNVRPEHLQQAERVKESLRRAVAAALERKRRLGQYAVFYRDGKPVRVGPEQLGREHRD